MLKVQQIALPYLRIQNSEHLLKDALNFELGHLLFDTNWG